MTARQFSLHRGYRLPVTLVTVSMLLMFGFLPSGEAQPEEALPGDLFALQMLGISSPRIIDPAGEADREQRAAYPHQHYPGEAELRELDRIVISLPQQRLFALNSNDEALHVWPVSTGTAQYRTPTGEFSIINSHHRAYSEKYEAWMTDWMAITPDGAYGIHGLDGMGYYRHLGSPASHGCIRLARENAQLLRSKTALGTPVKIVSVEMEFPGFEEAEQQRREDFYDAYLSEFEGYRF